MNPLRNFWPRGESAEPEPTPTPAVTHAIAVQNRQAIVKSRHTSALTYLILIISIGILAWNAQQAHNAARTAKRAAATAKMLAADTRAISIANQSLIRSNANAIAYINRFRVTRIRETSKSDLKLCRAINVITARDRATIVGGPRVTPGLLRLLGIPPSIIARYVAQQVRIARREVFARPFLHCRALPSQPK